MNASEIQRMIEAGIPGCEVHIDGDGTHWFAEVISDAFQGLPMLKQHRLVYATLGENMGGAIHALSIQTYTREAWANARQLKTL